MKLPPGVGSVHMIGDGKRRRKPWRARVQAGIDFNAETGRATQKYITLGYFETETEAIAALFEYRKDPYTLEAATATFADVFEMWKEKKYATISVVASKSYDSAYKNSEPLHNLKFREIRTSHLDEVMLNLPSGYKVQTRLKTFWGQLFKYAMEHDLIQKNYAEFVKTRDKDPGTKRTAIAKEDIEKIWAAIDAGDRDAEIAMIYIYTGMRPSELLEVQKARVDLKGRMLIGGLKTEAGIDRHVPLHKCILPFMERLMQSEGEYLVMRPDTKKPTQMAYQRFKKHHWDPLMERLGLEKYTMHYTRHTCATMMREAEIAEDLRKLILGHANGDITDRYTHHPDYMLIDAIDKLPGR